MNASVDGPVEVPVTPVVPSIPVLWAPFLATICLAAAMDVCYVSRGSRENCHLPSYARQIVWWVLVGILFGGWVVLLLGWSAGASWSYGYFLEYMLSVDNLFVFQLVFKSYATPESHVEGALFWGIAAAILLRLGFFGVGTSLLAMGFVSRLVFGVLLIYSVIKVAWKPWQPDATLCNVELQVFATEAKHNWKVTSNIGHMWFPGPRSPMEFRSLEAIFNKPS